jgi:hypothetical protein
MLLFVIAVLASCEKDEGKLPNISFKTGGIYLSADCYSDRRKRYPCWASMLLNLKRKMC